MATGSNASLDVFRGGLHPEWPCIAASLDPHGQAGAPLAGAHRPEAGVEPEDARHSRRLARTTSVPGGRRIYHRGYVGVRVHGFRRRGGLADGGLPERPGVDPSRAQSAWVLVRKLRLFGRSAFERGAAMKSALMKSPRKIDWPRVLLDACRSIERSESEQTLSELAGSLKVSPSELQRQFTRRLGVSPKAYGQALQLHRLTRRAALERTALDATLAAGFESTAVAYSAAGSALGVPPGGLRKPLDIGWWLGLSDLGWMLLAATERGICWLAFGDQPGAMLQEL